MLLAVGVQNLQLSTLRYVYWLAVQHDVASSPDSAGFVRFKFDFFSIVENKPMPIWQKNDREPMPLAVIIYIHLGFRHQRHVDAN